MRHGLVKAPKRSVSEIETDALNRVTAQITKRREEEAAAETAAATAAYYRRDPLDEFRAAAHDDHDPDLDDYEDDEGEEEQEGREAPLPPEDAKRTYMEAAHTSAYAKASIEAAFAAGQAAGRREQLPPPPCKSCKLRKERNRIAAKESRLKKKAVASNTAELIRQGAEIAVQRQQQQQQLQLQQQQQQQNQLSDDSVQIPPF